MMYGLLTATMTSPHSIRPMLSNRNRGDEHKPICHSWLHDGVWQFLGDCTHAMAGQSVPMIPPEPGATFQRRHGWHLYPWTDDEGNPVKESG